MIKKTELIKKCRKIKLIISDVDGVLTDGGMYYGKTGEIMKKFNTRDGMGVSLISDKVKINLMTRENSEIVLRRAKKMKVDHVYMGIKDKELLLPEICKKYKILKEEVAYIGDDVNDLKIFISAPDHLLHLQPRSHRQHHITVFPKLITQWRGDA